MIKIAPSLLSADFACLGEEVRRVESGGADMIHIDVMDGHFVPNITLGPGVIRSLRRHTKLPFDVHLMVDRPDAFIADFAEAGADYLTVHVEACLHLHRTIQHIRSLGVKAGIALNPATPAVMAEPVLEELDMVLVMSVNPGFGGQDFIPGCLHKLRQLRQMIDEVGREIELEVDGGLNGRTGPMVAAAGASVLVAGSWVYGSADPAGAIAALRSACTKLPGGGI